ncbi:Protein HRP-1 a [Aphelenchoides avenae]|nr:Protein HRP-1 a [Aphelenchus avenae]
MEARQLSWQYYAQVEALQQEILALRAASDVFAAPPAPTTTMPSSNQIYVAKITSAMTEDVLREHFSQFGHVSHIIVKRHPDQSGYAFVHFASPVEALHALRWNGHIINGHNIIVRAMRR